MALSFEWDPRKAVTNLKKHGVSFEEATSAFSDPFGRIADDPRHSIDEARYALLGISLRQRMLSVMFVERGESRDGREGVMKKAPRKNNGNSRSDLDEILPEYDFSNSRPNKYAARYAAGSNVVVLDPDVAAMFSSAGEVNEALRALGGIIQRHHPPKRKSRAAGSRQQH